MPGSTWNWVNGQALAFGWAPDEPNSGAEDCVELYNDKDYYLNDDECYERHPFICETPGINQRTPKCKTPTPLVLNASPDVTTHRQSLWLDLININDYAKFHQNIASSLPCK